MLSTLGPRLRAAFTAAEAWGTISQKREGGKQTNRIEVRWGKLRLETLAVELPEGAVLGEASVLIAGSPVDAETKQQGGRVTLTLPEHVVVSQGEAIELKLTC